MPLVIVITSCVCARGVMAFIAHSAVVNGEAINIPRNVGRGPGRNMSAGKDSIPIHGRIDENRIRVLRKFANAKIQG